MCPKKGINPTVLLWGWDWDHKSYSGEGSGCLGNGGENISGVFSTHSNHLLFLRFACSVVGKN